MARVMAVLFNGPGGLNAVELRHQHIHHDNVRMQPVRHLHRHLPVLRLPDHVEALFLVQQAAQTFAHTAVVVDKQHTDGHISTPVGQVRNLTPVCAQPPVLLAAVLVNASASCIRGKSARFS